MDKIFAINLGQKVKIQSNRETNLLFLIETLKARSKKECMTYLEERKVFIKNIIDKHMGSISIYKRDLNWQRCRLTLLCKIIEHEKTFDRYDQLTKDETLEKLLKEYKLTEFWESLVIPEADILNQVKELNDKDPFSKKINELILKQNEDTEAVNQWQSKLELATEKAAHVGGIAVDEWDWDLQDENGVRVEVKSQLDKRGDILAPKMNYKLLYFKAGVEPEELQIGPEICTDVGEKFEEVVDKKKGKPGAKKK